MPDIGDVIELTVDIRDRNLRAGVQGTIQEVLDFARFLSARSRQTAGGKGCLQGG